MWYSFLLYYQLSKSVLLNRKTIVQMTLGGFNLINGTKKNVTAQVWYLTGKISGVGIMFRRMIVQNREEQRTQ
ncbi:hypothetical protein BI291_06390 [Thalassotalea sp. PP2-459]|nr:hypothetical protein BI291_06390 [Thalassotalea sp. PP2-459]